MIDITKIKTLPLEHIIGLEEAKESLHMDMSLRSIHDQPQKITLLEGASGSCKTTLIQAIIKDFMERYPNRFQYEELRADMITAHVGTTATLIQNFWTRLRKMTEFKPTILFVDEADDVFGTRKDAGIISRERTVNIMMEINKEIPNLFIICATNRPYKMDTAMRERCNERIHCPYPSDEELKQIIDISLNILNPKQREVLHAHIINDMKPKKKADDGEGEKPIKHTWSGRDIKHMAEKFALIIEFQRLTHLDYTITNKDVATQFQYIVRSKNNLKNDYLD